MLRGHPTAIDNGLAFPFKHPDHWRSYPYGWAYIPVAHVPFSKKSREIYLPLLTSRSWWVGLTRDLKKLFQVDTDFNEKLFRRQIAVMKGQVFNLVQVLSRGMEGKEVSTRYLATFRHNDIAKKKRQSSSSSFRSSSTGLLNSTLRIADRNLVGTPFDLSAELPCLVWEDEDVRDLTNGIFGSNYAFGRDGILSTITGGSYRITNTKDKKGNAAYYNEGLHAFPIGEFLTSKDKFTKENNWKSNNFNDEESPQMLNSGSSHIETSDDFSSILGKKYRGSFNRITNEVGHKLDAFKGRVITYVKSKPWISWW